MKIIHISDIHLTIPGEEMGGLDPHARLERAMADITAKHADAVRIIVTGDLAHWGEAEAYGALKNVVEGSPVPMRLLIGNHDDRATFRTVFAEQATDTAGFINHAEVIEGTTFLYLDSVGEKTHAGHFCATRRAWLEEQLTAAPRARLFLHHNPMSLGLPAEDKIALVPEDQGPFLDLLERFADKIEYIHFGHVHAPISGMVKGIPFSSIPSTGNQSYPDLAEIEWLTGGPMEPAYYVLLINDRDTIIHSIPFNWDGPLSRSGTGWDDWAKPTEAAE